MNSRTRFLAVSCLAGVLSLAARARAQEHAPGPPLHDAAAILAQADAARDADRVADAIRLYEQAAEAYAQIAARDPRQQPRIVALRLAHCRAQAESLRRLGGAPPAEYTAAPPPGRAETEPEPPAMDLMDVLTVAQVLMEEGNTEDARMLLMDALDLEPDSLALRLELAALQCEAGHYTDALHVIHAVVDEAPGDAAARVLLATVHAGTGRLAEAEAELRFALDLDPELAAAHYNLAALLLAKDPPEADAARDHYMAYRRAGGVSCPALEAALD
jgi:tetratricopeptide (TPR) repeat protein